MSLIDYLIAAIFITSWLALGIATWLAETARMKALSEGILSALDGHRQARAARGAYRKAMKDAGK